MIHHQADVVLRVDVKGSAFGNETADEFVIALSRTFLPGRLRIAVKDPGAAVPFRVQLDSRRIGELTAVIRKYDLKDLLEMVSADTVIDPIEDVSNGLGIIVVTEKSEHEFSLHEVDRQKDLSAFSALDGIHLCNGQIRMLLHELQEEIKGPANAAFLVDFQVLLFLTDPETDLARQINVFGGDKSCVDEPVDRTLADHQPVPVGHADMVR